MLFSFAFGFWLMMSWWG